MFVCNYGTKMREQRWGKMKKEAHLTRSVMPGVVRVHCWTLAQTGIQMCQCSYPALLKSL